MYKSDVDDPNDRPTFGSLWVYRKPRWACGTIRRSYKQFVADFNQLTPDRVHWTPYTNQNTMERAPHGLAQLCMRDMIFWKTKWHLVFDVHVEAYNVQRLMKQFEMFQPYPPPPGLQLDHSLHTYSRKGLGLSYKSTVFTKLQPMVMQWDGASTDLHLDTPTDDGTTYAGYLRWYRASTRLRCLPGIDDTATLEQPSIRDTFAPQPSSAYNAMVEFIEEMHNETDELYTRLKTRPQQVSQGDVSKTLVVYAAVRWHSFVVWPVRALQMWCHLRVVVEHQHRFVSPRLSVGGPSMPRAPRRVVLLLHGILGSSTMKPQKRRGKTEGSVDPFFHHTSTSPWTHLSGACTSTHAPSSHRWRKVQAVKLLIFKTYMLSWGMTLPYLRCHPGRSWWTRCSDVTLDPIWIPTLTTGLMLRILRSRHSRLIQTPFSPRNNKDVTDNRPII